MNNFEINAHILNMSEELLYLIIKRLTNTIASDEVNTLQQWLENSAENQKIYNEVCDIWLASSRNSADNFDSFEALKKVKMRLQDYEESKINKKKIYFSPLFKVAAFILFLLTVGTLSYYAGSSRNNSNNEITEIEAPLGSRTRVNLPDGTKVWLNGGSKIKFANSFNKTNRAVDIVGEGYFDVKRNEKLPFVVNTKEIRIKVLGTAFNIKAYPDEGAVETTLERGSLAIEKLTLNGKSIPQTVLKPNQRATFIKNEGKVHLSDIDKKANEQVTGKEKLNNSVIKEPIKEQLLISKEIDTHIFTSWKDDKLVFRNESFESLTLKLERWYGVKIMIEDEEIKNYHFNGTFEKETIHDVLNIIHFALPIKYSVLHNQITISLDQNIGKNTKFN
jgi:ferric-dicitrate binding protein FerR (iron transport regulator)